MNKENEAKAIAIVWNMAAESLPPDEFAELENAISIICHNMHIDNQLLKEITDE